MHFPGIFDTLREDLKHPVEEEIIELIDGLIGICQKIATQLRSAPVEALKSKNKFGEQQLSVDMLAESLMWEYCRASPLVRGGCSEEAPDPIITDEKGSYFLCWDPLDGSSIIGCNWSVGTIIGIWPLKNADWDPQTALVGHVGREQTASMVAVYGPRLTFAIAVGGITFEVMESEGRLVLSRSTEKCRIQPSSKIFSPANLRASADLPWYKELIASWMEERYTLRYSGGLVPDVYQQIIKGGGVFSNPTSDTAKAKLRLLYEVLPMALIVENAGGLAIEGHGKIDVLDMTVDDMDQRLGVCLGSSLEVEKYRRLVIEKSPSHKGA